MQPRTILNHFEQSYFWTPGNLENRRFENYLRLVGGGGWLITRVAWWPLYRGAGGVERVIDDLVKVHTIFSFAF